MNLRVKDAAALLHVSEKTIYRWVSQAKLPFHRVNSQYRFNRADLFEWATSNRVPVSPQIMEEPGDALIPPLAEALQTGGIYYRVEGGTKPWCSSVVNIFALPQEVDREFLYQVLLARESLGSTAIGEASPSLMCETPSPCMSTDHWSPSVSLKTPLISVH